ncbi:MAG: S-layer homology domain-containing protein [Acidimicrobiales bacterium]|nr:S-layer homology domain-containing protein [Acidimicrobiales bacterium]MDG1878458.1 S-layer homology domain-containing protein [Acidimicrobiales bacterium]
MSALHISRSRLRTPGEADTALAHLSQHDMTAPGFARRSFLQGSLSLGGAASLTLTPGFFDKIAAASTPLPPLKRILVTVFLEGGNDHLNTLIPAENGAYHDARGSLSVSVDGTTAVGEGLHLHPNLARLKARFDAGQVAFVRGVGEASDDQSHFTSTATWMAGIQNMLPATGWLGRYQDGAGLGPLGAVAVGWHGVPLTLRGGFSSAVALPPHGDLLGADRAEASERDAFDFLAGLKDSGAGHGIFGPFVANAFAKAINTAETISPAFTDVLPEDGLARQLALAARVINLDVGTKLVDVAHSGYDTHEGQRPYHDDLMAELDAGIDAFFSNLHPTFAGRTAVLVFSEFGRRVDQNASGTDHGTTGLAMLVGPNVVGGLHGQQPSLTDLDERGNMRHSMDFRSVYASVLDDWLDADAREILGANYPTVDLFSESGSSLFADVNSNAYYDAPVGWLAAEGITNGTSPSTFSPEAEVTRGQMAAFLFRYKGEPGGSPHSPFVDVARDRFFARPIDWMHAQGITTGTSAVTFSSEDVVTRGQMATFLWRMEGEAPAPPAGFADVSRSRYYAKAVDWLFDRGITTGTTSTTFSPEAPVTRGQLATFLWRLAGSPA